MTAQYDTATCVHPSLDRHSDRGITKGLEKVVGELNTSKVFCNIPGRTHAAFKTLRLPEVPSTRKTYRKLDEEPLSILHVGSCVCLHSCPFKSINKKHFNNIQLTLNFTSTVKHYHIHSHPSLSLCPQGCKQHA